MSKKISENLKTPPKDNNISLTDTFSFLELNKFLSQDIHKKDNKEKSNTKIINNKKESEKIHKLKNKPNENIGRDQTSEDIMYIENEDEFLKEESIKEAKKEAKKEEKKRRKKRRKERRKKRRNY